LEVRLVCDTIATPKLGRRFVAESSAWGTWTGSPEDYSLDLVCGDFDPVDLTCPSQPGVTATVAPAHGHEPTDLVELYEESLAWIGICQDCGLSPDQIVVRLSDFTTADCGPLANGDYALTKGGPCGTYPELRYGYVFNPQSSLRLHLIPGEPLNPNVKILLVEYHLVSFGFDGALWSFRTTQSDLFDCDAFVDLSLPHYYGSSCHAANASVILNPSS
jgi:hypothetical protein